MFEEYNAPSAVALQGLGTNAMVDNPFTFEESPTEAPATALQGLGTNALVENPFN